MAERNTSSIRFISSSVTRPVSAKNALLQNVSSENFDATMMAVSSSLCMFCDTTQNDVASIKRSTKTIASTKQESLHRVL